jgi:hypothetical protein
LVLVALANFMRLFSLKALLGGLEYSWLDAENTKRSKTSMMTLNGASAAVEYYEVPLLQEARKFNVTDAV